MSTEQTYNSPLEHLAEFRSFFFQSAISMFLAYLTTIVIFTGVLSGLSVFTTLSKIVDTSGYPAYIIAAGSGWTLYMTVQHLENAEEEEESGEVKEDLSISDSFKMYEDKNFNELLKIAFKQSFKGLAVTTYISILVSLGALIGLVLSSYLSGVIAIIVTIIYPIVDVKYTQNVS